MRTPSALFALLLLCGACAAAQQKQSANAQPATPIEVALFPLSATAPIYVAVDQGFYSRAGLDVRLTATPDSTQLVSGLASGKYQFAAALIDNFVAYEAKQHNAPYVKGHDLRAVMGLATASASLVSSNDVGNMGYLHRRRVGVDAPNSGFAFLLYGMIEQQAKMRPGDYQVIVSGSTKARWEALSRGEIDATMLTPEFTALAMERQLRVLSNSESVFPKYMGVAIGADETWAKQNARVVQAFLRATLEARQWLGRPENLAAAAASVSKRLDTTAFQMTGPLRSLIENSVLIPDGSVDMEGLATVIDLRKKYAPGFPSDRSPESFLDLSYLNRAREELRAH
jgi:ABC-type nitrate/sulfonate/bicarbonate transport system substrate-binding protein